MQDEGNEEIEQYSETEKILLGELKGFLKNELSPLIFHISQTAVHFQKQQKQLHLVAVGMSHRCVYHMFSSKPPMK